MLYRVKALEKIQVFTWYTVEADSPEAAEDQLKNGEVQYDRTAIDANYQVEHIKTLWIKPVTKEHLHDVSG